MDTFKSFEKELSNVNESNFENIALSLFQYQAKKNKVYNEYITYLGVNPTNVNRLESIPFLPISLFKTLDIITGDWKPETTFLSSTTTGMIPSRHAVKSMAFYLRNATSIFKQFYGPVTDFHFFALLPSYLERDGSSLVAMVGHFIKESKSIYSSSYLQNRSELIQNLSKVDKAHGKIIVWGVSFALMDLAEGAELDLSNCIVMETGGMKGKREELTREEMHQYLCSRFHVNSIHSEYGMTELFSQAYSSGLGYFHAPPGMKIMVRDINDPFETLGSGKTGGINVIDLANIYTCSFVETQDLGRIRQDGSFEVLGRIDNSDIRGCNLLVG